MERLQRNGTRRWMAVAVLGSAAVMSTITPASAGSAGGTGSAGGAGSRAAVSPCGYYAGREIAFYNHCGPTTIKIKLDIVRGFDRTICVGPGDTRLGLKSQIRDANYVGGAGCRIT
ncbi:DUF6355 family natural product biosynthesis protein [Streptomyces sp. NPDC002602]|uniref:DUF6355 family natural product biosynthesis protein n=1 Tax=Streptomyces sp. NPDC002602 TaxID=3364654 RepID=UPI0036A4AD13